MVVKSVVWSSDVASSGISKKLCCFLLPVLFVPET